MHCLCMLMVVTELCHEHASYPIMGGVQLCYEFTHVSKSCHGHMSYPIMGSIEICHGFTHVSFALL